MKGNLVLADFIALAPLLTVTIWGCLVLLGSALGGRGSLRMGGLSAFGLLIGLVVCGASWVGDHATATTLFGGMMLSDRFALYLDALFIVAGLITVGVAGPYIEEHDCAEGEFFAMVLLAISGMMMMVHAGDLVMLVIGLETMSLAAYGLVASWGGNRRSAEAGLKYFIMGAVASAFLLYGIALLYGATGATDLQTISRQSGGEGGSALYLLGMYMVLGAMAFKVSLVPFHMWAPDAYQGAPTPVTGLMASAVKAAGFGALLRLVETIFGAQQFVYGSTGWINVLWTLSVLTMTVGNLSALRQRNIKRMLAYSSISHAGYLLIGVVALGLLPGQSGPVLFYLLSYSVTTLGAFAIVSWIGRRDAELTELDQWRGLAKRHPFMALLMTLFMLSLGGIPPTAGFFAKLYLFRSALETPQLLSLVIIAVINSIISIFYYLRPVVAMYFRDADAEPEGHPLRSYGLYTAVGIAGLFVLVLGVMPGPFLELATSALLGR